MDWSRKVHDIVFAGWTEVAIAKVVGATLHVIKDLGSGRQLGPRWEVGDAILAWNDMARRAGLLLPYPSRMHAGLRNGSVVASEQLELVQRLYMKSSTVSRRIGAWEEAITGWKNGDQRVPIVFAGPLFKMCDDIRSVGLVDFICPPTPDYVRRNLTGGSP